VLSDPRGGLVAREAARVPVPVASTWARFMTGAVRADAVAPVPGEGLWEGPALADLHI